MTPRGLRGRINHDRWLVSYADFITLLFGFFVVLFAFAKSDQKKQSQVSQAIDSAFQSLGVFSAGSQGSRSGFGQAGQSVASGSAVMKDNLLSPEQVKDDLEHIRLELEQALSSQIARHAVAVHMEREGLVISLREAGFFSSGSATPRPETLPTLRQVAASVGHTPYNLRIEGH